MNSVKSLSRSGNSRKDQAVNLAPGTKDSSSVSLLPNSVDLEDQEVKAADAGRRVVEKENASHSSATDHEKLPSTFSSNYAFNGREEAGGVTFPSIDRDKVDMKNTYGSSTSQRGNYYQNSVDAEEKVQKVSPPRRKGPRDEKQEKPGNWMKKDVGGSDLSTSTFPQQNAGSYSQSNAGSKRHESELIDGNINAILEEEEALIAAHRKEIEDTMEIVREEMKLLAEVDQPGSLIDNYVTQLSFVLSRKAASLVSLQARLARFQHRLKEQEILSRKRVPR